MAGGSFSGSSDPQIDDVMERPGQDLGAYDSAGAPGEGCEMLPLPGEAAAVEPEPEGLEREVRRDGQDRIDDMEMPLGSADAQGFLDRLEELLVVEVVRC